MTDKSKLKLVELDADQMKALLKGGVVKLEKEGIRISLSMSREEIEDLCAEIEAASAEEAGEEDQEGESGSEDIA